MFAKSYKKRYKCDVTIYTVAVPIYNRSISNSEWDYKFSFASHKICRQFMAPDYLL